MVNNLRTNHTTKVNLHIINLKSWQEHYNKELIEEDPEYISDFARPDKKHKCQYKNRKGRSSTKVNKKQKEYWQNSSNTKAHACCTFH